ncbi:paired amphipathic helix protein pst1-like isoform X2 [Panicum hallii]|uniref:paired amphipathic helix protein pst1-like isoform X2 n=1 Tax=Panicum hallii TaxID=206008 RepID=UPI000DF4D02E|nr:paired amphipathic helix protein pst1-like isoform X2 [Panicum hallii]
MASLPRAMHVSESGLEIQRKLPFFCDLLRRRWSRHLMVPHRPDLCSFPSTRRLAPPPADWPASVLQPSDDWIEFRRAVRYEFAGKPGKNQDFLAVMRGFSLGFGVDGVVSYLQPLFQGYPDLIRKFNTFLPGGYELRDRQGGGADA